MKHCLLYFRVSKLLRNVADFLLQFSSRGVIYFPCSVYPAAEIQAANFKSQIHFLLRSSYPDSSAIYSNTVAVYVVLIVTAATMATPQPKIKILMLHGFAQSGPFFQIKTRALTKMLLRTISRCYNVMAEDVELVFPTAPLQLRVSDRIGTCAEGPQFLDDSDIWAWWQNLDVTTRYIGIESSLAALMLLVQKHGPFTGVVGFSQGATLAAMFASWCESGSVPGRSEVLREMSNGEALQLQLLSSPPQCRLDFALCLSGFRGTPSFYHGFYTPEIVTPTIHILGELDTMVCNTLTEQLIGSCLEPKVLRHQGVHFVPSNVDVLNQISKSLESIIGKAAASVLYPSLLLDSEEYCVTLPLGNDVVLADARETWRPTSSHSFSDSASDTDWRPRSRHAYPPRIVRRHRRSRKQGGDIRGRTP